MKKIIVAIVFSCGFLLGWSQSEGEIRGDGVVIPSLTTTERNTISSPDEGHLIYNESTDELQVRRNGAWQALGSGGGGGATWQIKDLNEMNTAVSAIDAATNYVQLTVEGDASWYWYRNDDGDIRVDISNASGNTFIGKSAGESNLHDAADDEGENNTFLGSAAGSNNTTGSNNTLVGEYAGGENMTGSDNTMLGRSAGASSGAHQRGTFLGRLAGGGGTVGTFDNTFVGHFAGAFLSGTSAGNFNTLLGSYAGEGIGSNDENVFIGYQSGRNISNTAISGWNVAIGSGAGRYLQQGNNVMIGFNAGQNSTQAVGAGINTSSNVIIGYQAGKKNTLCCNTYLGNFAGTNNEFGTGNVFIGSNAGDNLTNTDNTLIIEVAPHAPLISGKFDDGEVTVHGDLFVTSLTTSGGVASDVHVSSTGRLIKATSDGRLKKNVETLTGTLDKLKQIRGVSFEWKEGENPDKTLGVIAQEVDRVFPDVVHKGKDDEYYGVNYSEFAAIFIEAIKEQQLIIEEMQATHDVEMAELRVMIDGLTIKKEINGKYIDQ